ncbi:scavenger receptor cysteine-rich domain-containing protein DMBT1-like [Argopecten irradians]|uniref:scavenger receptor cysteine-rich domain-containing protein DMBT1-like n=1 Tax=Argopecten irradians TaxID=31199 RepID=UPI0037218937
MAQWSGLLTTLVLLINANLVTAQTCQSTPLTLPATEELQILTSPNYPSSYPPSRNCKWWLDAGDADHLVFIDITAHSIEFAPGCSYDGMFVYDGQQVSLLKAVCGTASHRAIDLYKSTGQYATIWFRSDSSVQLQGATLRYFRYPATTSSVCPSAMALNATTTIQYLYSPGFPNLADVTEECSWLISAESSADDIILEVIYSNIVSGEVCYTDILHIYDGSNDTATELAQVCSDKVNFVSVTVISSRDKMFLKLSKQYSLTARTGFVVSYNSTNRGRTVPPTTTVPAVPTYSVCSTATVTATSSLQQITSPNYPDLYGNFHNCYLTIEAPGGEQIFLNLVDSAIQSSIDCSNDGLAIYDGPSSSSVRLGLFCGEDQTASINSTGSSLTLFFYGDGSSSNRGFKLEFTSAPHVLPDCIDSSVNITYLNATTTVQYFSSPNYPDPYNLDESLYWIIYDVTESGIIKINVEDSRIEASYHCVFDRVTVYKGPCTSYPKLGTFCGEEVKTYYQEAGDYALVIFTSDNSVTFKGFNISYVLVSSTPEQPTDYTLLIYAIVGGILGALALAGLIFVIVRMVQVWRSTAPISSIDRKRRDSESSTSSTFVRTTHAISALSAMRMPLLRSTAKLKKPKLPKIRS